MELKKNILKMWLIEIYNLRIFIFFNNYKIKIGEFWIQKILDWRNLVELWALKKCFDSNNAIQLEKLKNSGIYGKLILIIIILIFTI